jgi:uncharacterized protein YdeI (YjbR/CyaY-like superfamily)
MKTSVSVLEFYPENRAAWRAWLTENHTKNQSVWVMCYKKSSTMPTLRYEELVQECLCFGWVDGKPTDIDDEKFKLFCAPRRPNSIWSASNKKRVALLTEAGLMMPAGVAAMHAAQTDGSWDAKDDLQPVP